MKHLEVAAHRAPEAIALELSGRRYSYAQLWALVSARARQLRSARAVAVVGGLSLEAIVDLWAALTEVPLVCLIHAKLQPAEREKALALYERLDKAQRGQVPQNLRVWLRYRSEKYFGEDRTPPKKKG